MKKLAFTLVLFCFLSSNSLFSQNIVKTSGFISTASFTVGVISNFKDLNNAIKITYPEYNTFNPAIQTGFTLGFGYYFKNRFTIATESFVSSAPSVTVHENQYAELRNYGSKLEVSYVFYRYRNFDFEFSVGFGGQYNNFLHTVKDENETYRPNLALSSMNSIVPIGLRWWIYKDGLPYIGGRAFGLSLNYNIIAHKGVTTVTGFTSKAHFPNISSNSLWISIVLKM